MNQPSFSAFATPATAEVAPNFCLDASKTDALAIQHLDLVRAIALSIARSLPRFVELNDLIQYGTLGLLDAARKYDPAQPASFQTYAKHRIRGAILDNLRREDTVSRELRGYQKKIQSATAQVEQREQREATSEELAAAMGMDTQRLAVIQMRIRQGSHVQIGKPTDEGDWEMEFPDCPSRRPDAQLERQMLREQVRRAIEELPERCRMVLQLYYVEDLTMREIGQILGVNESRISQLHKRASARLAEILGPQMKRRPAAVA